MEANPPLPTSGSEHGRIAWRHSGEGIGAARVLRDGLPVLLRLRADGRRSADELHRVQTARLRALLVHARDRVPAYRRRFEEAGVDPAREDPLAALAAMTPLERAELRDHPRSLFARPRDPARRRVLRWVRTSGSSGRPVTVAFDTAEWVQSVVTILHGFAGAGWRPWRPLAYLCVPTFRRRPSLPARLGLFREELVDLREGAPANLARLRALRPGAVYGYPSQLELIARRISEGEPGPHPRVVLTNGEVLTEGVRATIRSAFGCPVRDTYGCAEVHRVAEECPEGRLHVVPSAAWVETDPDSRAADGSEELLLTSLYQRTMPLIRYRVGDRVVRGEGRCPCGSGQPLLGRVVGRADDLLRLPSGRRLSARSLSRLEEVPGVREFQIVQRSLGRIELLVVPERGFDERGADRAVELVRSALGDEPVGVELRRVEAIERTERGKRQAVVSELEP
jgi:phenylacetate-CoA ligase